MYYYIQYMTEIKDEHYRFPLSRLFFWITERWGHSNPPNINQPLLTLTLNAETAGDST